MLAGPGAETVLSLAAGHSANYCTDLTGDLTKLQTGQQKKKTVSLKFVHAVVAKFPDAAPQLEKLLSEMCAMPSCPLLCELVRHLWLI